MAQSDRPAKRRRTFDGGAYHDPVPFLNPSTFNIIHASEGALRRVGNSVRTSRLAVGVQPAAGVWESTMNWSPPDDTQFALDADSEAYDEALESAVMEDTPLPQNPRKKKSTVSDVKIALLGVLTHQANPSIGVRNAFNQTSYHPFHRIEKWSGGQFVSIPLKDIGLKIQLNHSSMFCENPVPAHTNMLVLHTNGFHSVAVQYCGCSRAIPHHIQLLRRRLYPASQLSVKTCATFELLHLLHKMSLATKASAYDFYRCLEWLTDGTGIKPQKSRYRALCRMLLQWRHLHMLKWAGVSHQVGGISAIQPGQLAVRCPSCPYPGINLRDDWECVPEEFKFLYMAYICMDANFRLKNQLVSNYSQDPGQGIGWAYMVPRKPYEAYVLGKANDEDISTCVSFQALAKSNNKFDVGLRYTGSNITVCGRSEMIFPLGVGNLQKGERYSNMDYIFGSALQFVLVNTVLISYDIMCQWFINLFKRIDKDWPDHIKPRAGMNFIPAIPKLHEPMHKVAGHEVYSLNFIKGVGHSDCECVERVWAPHNALANSTKTQGPGSRQDVLDDHFGFWNWQKYISMGSTLLRRYTAAVKERNLQVEAHRGLMESLDKTLVEKWESMCIEWDNDVFPKTAKNPYQLDGAGKSEAQVKKELADEESKYLSNGGTYLHATTASMFVYMGLDLEETHKISITTFQTSYTSPCEINSYNPPSERKSSNPEDAALWLPSRIDEPYRSKICIAGLATIEERIRDAQLPDALENIKKILKIKSRLIAFKNKNIRGQRGGTRSRAVIDRVHDRARYSAEKYRDAHLAKHALTGPGDWEKVFRILEDGDIRGYQDPNRLRQHVGRRGVLEDDQVDRPHIITESGEFTLFNESRTRRDGTGETHRTLSWIWLTTPSAGSDDEKDDILRSEWARSRARATRGMEEVMLLKEEMRRVLSFLEWKARWWRDRQSVQSVAAKDLQDGLASYARRQAAVQDALAARFRSLWKAPLSSSVEAQNEGANTVDGGSGDDNNNDDDDSDADEEADMDTGFGAELDS
ncbi:hypothetical protein BDN70DRAFT_909531 [Pholiota conissans]|uniref:CxC2-like cysteine cluster KDZ transposase-associated domain-containing protein n=1 Tax=Pholiota conissans TaxID=109636 RepID=A0A9P5YI88_9AGAR|nr:hypothetical protein BDN70DRAFT_909531 [Pholiota conissans]